ncbi:MAG: phage regulatory CII family protein [Pseudomonadota bacterium]|nr:phage regulatory CII family protein [Pseudomonadota bacterium]
MTAQVLSYRPNTYGSLKQAVASLVHNAGGVRPAAELCRVGKSQLSDFANEYKEDSHAPVDVIMALERATGCRFVTDHLAAAHGCVVVQLPTGEALGIPTGALDMTGWLNLHARAAKEAAELTARIAQDLADGKITVAEARVALRECDEALAAIAACRVALEQIITAAAP